MKHSTTVLAALVALPLFGACAAKGPVQRDVDVPGAKVVRSDLGAALAGQSECSARVANLLTKMTTPEKAGQMVNAWQANASPEDVSVYNLGAVFSGGDSAAGATGYDDPGDASFEAWARMTDAYHAAARGSRLGIPVLYGIDAVHGNSKTVGATIFPHNIGLGCANDADLVRAVGEATAREVAAVGVNWVFGPSAGTAADERWGRTFESFGEDPLSVEPLAAAKVRGLQGARGSASVLACAKHFAGDGLTVFGTSTAKPDWTDRHGLLDRGDVRMDEATFRRIAIATYRSSIQAGVGSIMASFSSWNGTSSHGNKYLLTEILKGELGFRGFVVGDYHGHTALGADLEAQLVAAFNAGVDMVMEPTDWKSAIRHIVNQAGKRIAHQRIDDAVTRILSTKCEAGLFGRERDAGLKDDFGDDRSRSVAREAVRRSLVLLKNDAVGSGGAPLPLRNKSRVFISGSGSDDLTRQCGGWTINWQGKGSATQGTTIRQAIEKRAEVVEQLADAEVAVVVLSEPSYAEWFGDDAKLQLEAADIVALRTARAASAPVVAILLSGRPLIITEHLDLADAWLAAWLPGTEGDGIADVVFGDAAPSGKLNHSWPRSVSQLPLGPDTKGAEPLFPRGYGLGYEAE